MIGRYWRTRKAGTEMTKWILAKDRRTPVQVDFMTWAKWIETAEKLVQRTDVPGGYVSTVFLGIDHRFGGSGPPLLFETMIFGGPHDEYQQRYSTWEEAEVGHRKAVELASLATSL